MRVIKLSMSRSLGQVHIERLNHVTVKAVYLLYSTGLLHGMEHSMIPASLASATKYRAIQDRISPELAGSLDRSRMLHCH